MIHIDANKIKVTSMTECLDYETFVAPSCTKKLPAGNSKINGISIIHDRWRCNEFFFSKLTDLDEKECKIHDLTLEKFQRARDERNQD